VAVLVLLVGLYLFGTGEALLVNASLGVSPWTVLAQGIGNHLGINVGWATLIISCFVLLLWIPIKERPGLGTIANALVIALALERGVGFLPTPTAVGWQLAEVLAGVVTIGVGSGLYLTTNLGPGPRDGWMTGVHHKTGWPVARVRLGIEIVALGLGWLLGGTVGIGTVLFALMIGPSVAYGLKVVGVVAGVRSAPEIEDEFPELEA
jgi:uncharacterized membrane protein YczE